LKATGTNLKALKKTELENDATLRDGKNPAERLTHLEEVNSVERTRLLHGNQAVNLGTVQPLF